jgi:Protein of unknown function (DUF1161)
MKHILVAIGFSVLSLNAFALKPCGELKNEIADKLDAKGVKNYTLTIVDNAEVADQKVVGSCEGGTKKITYVRDAAPAPAPVETPTEAPAETQP